MNDKERARIEKLEDTMSAPEARHKVLGKRRAGAEAASRLLDNLTSGGHAAAAEEAGRAALRKRTEDILRETKQ